MTDYRLRNHDLLAADRRPPRTLWIAAVFTAIGFVAMAAAMSGLADRFNPASGFGRPSAQVGSTTTRGHPRP
jgi:hypothetical protein